MSKRIKINQAEPAAYKAMLALENYVEKSGLSTSHQDLIKIRASQINGCAFCVDMHTKEAKEHGETDQRIFTISVWRDTTFFNEQERAILALTEEITLISNKVSDETYNKAAELFDPSYLSKIIMCIITINAWNRIGISTELQPTVRLD